jgi:lipopolysaccharide biosynthesis glycosyltransferase
MLLDYKKAITFATNKSYQEYAVVLIKSLRRVFDGLIVCRCVNCDPEFIAFLEKYEVFVIEDNPPLEKIKKLKNPFDTPILKSGRFNKNCLCDDEVTYTCHSRFYNAKFIFDNFNPSSIVLIDCDFIVLKNFDEIFKLDYDVIIKDSIECVHEDCIVLKNTPTSKIFIDNIIKELEKNLFFWDQDTIALKAGFNSTNNLNVGELDLKYKDYKLSDDSSIWSGDGQAKYEKKFLDKFYEILQQK